MKFALKLPSRLAKTKDPAPSAGDFAGQDTQPDETERSGMGRFLDRKRVLRVVALLSVAWAAGQLMQTLQQDKAPQRVAESKEAFGETAPTKVIVVSGEGVGPSIATVNAEVPKTQLTLAAATEVAKEAPPLPVVAATMPQVSVPEIELTAATPELTPEPLPSAAPEVQLAEATAVQQVEAPSTQSGATSATQPCPVTLDLAAVPGAMIGVTLIAPCAPNSRVVLQHQGLSITGVTTSTGALFTSFPALATLAEVKVSLPGAEAVTASLDVPLAANFRRFAVQWQGDDAFQVNAYENGAAYGQPGHVSESKPNLVSDAGGFLQMIGDPSSALPLLAQVYTYPVSNIPVEISVESAVTAKTCGRELIGETIFSTAGRVVVTDLTLAMPECDAIGDFLVLNNLVPDVTLAAN